MSDPATLNKRLRSGDARIGVWGTGFIGFSTMAYFGNNGIRSIGFDLAEQRVDKINEGDVPVPYDLESWMGFRVEPLVEDGLLAASGDYGDLLTPDVPVHFVAVPTEKGGYPWEGALQKTTQRIAEYENLPDFPVVLILESTLTPGMTEDIVLPTLEQSDLEIGEDIVIGVAPRRDWFISPDKSLRTIPRVYGGQDERTSDYMEAVLEIVCENLERAPNHREAELVKSVENAYRHVGITLANQLARAYPDTDMRSVLELAGTKWNIPTYYPSVGTGGYCVPVASQYVLSGTDYEDELPILHETIETDNEQPLVVADALAEQDVDSVGILGLAYKGDLLVDVLTPTVPIATRLQEHDVAVEIHDPYYDDDYIADQTDAAGMSFPEGLADKDAVVIVADHRRYDYTPHNEILDLLDPGTIVVDNHKMWADLPFDDHGIDYTYTGGEGWLTPVIGRDRDVAVEDVRNLR